MPKSRQLMVRDMRLIDPNFSSCNRSRYSPGVWHKDIEFITQELLKKLVGRRVLWLIKTEGSHGGWSQIRQERSKNTGNSISKIVMFVPFLDSKRLAVKLPVDQVDDIFRNQCRKIWGFFFIFHHPNRSKRRCLVL